MSLLQKSTFFYWAPKDHKKLNHDTSQVRKEDAVHSVDQNARGAPYLAPWSSLPIELLRKVPYLLNLEPRSISFSCPRLCWFSLNDTLLRITLLWISIFAFTHSYDLEEEVLFGIWPSVWTRELHVIKWWNRRGTNQLYHLHSQRCRCKCTGDLISRTTGNRRTPFPTSSYWLSH